MYEETGMTNTTYTREWQGEIVTSYKIFFIIIVTAISYYDYTQNMYNNHIYNSIQSPPSYSHSVVLYSKLQIPSPTA